MDFAAELQRLPAQIRTNLLVFAPYIKDGAKELVMNRPGEIGVEYPGQQWQWFENPKLDLSFLYEFARVMASFTGQRFDHLHPHLSCVLPGGHRLQIIADHCTSHQFALAVRLKGSAEYRLADFGLSQEAQKQLNAALQKKHNILIAGGTGTGKTTLLNALIAQISTDERLIAIEGVPELDTSRHHALRMQYSENQSGDHMIGPDDLLNMSLRMRPCRLIFGELRLENVMGFYTALNTGHKGMLATIHASGAELAISSLLNRILVAGGVPSGGFEFIKHELSQLIDGVVYIERQAQGRIAAAWRSLSSCVRYGTARNSSHAGHNISVIEPRQERRAG